MTEQDDLRSRDFSTSSRQARGRSKKIIISIIFVLFVCLFSGAAAFGSSAELVVQHGDGRIVTKTVTFKETSISGTELLRRSGLDLSIVSGSIGEAVYMIDGEGDPNGWVTADGKSYFWNYFRLVEGKWKYSATGAGTVKVKDGDTEGWLWQAYGAGGTLPAATATAKKAEAKKPAASPSSESSTSSAGSYLGFAIIAAALLAAGIFFAFRRFKDRP